MHQSSTSQAIPYTGYRVRRSLSPTKSIPHGDDGHTVGAVRQSMEECKKKESPRQKILKILKSFRHANTTLRIAWSSQHAVGRPRRTGENVDRTIQR